MTRFVPKDENYQAKVRQSFENQEAMQTINAALVSVTPGRVELELEYDSKLTQQHGFLHAGMSAAVLDTACGYAAFSLMPKDSAVLSVEFKVNLLAPAKGERFIALGRVKKAGKTITVCEGELFAVQKDEKILAATMTATMMCLANKKGIEN